MAVFKMIPSEVSHINLKTFQQENLSVNFVMPPRYCKTPSHFFSPLLAAIIAMTYLMHATKYSMRCIC